MIIRSDETADIPTPGGPMRMHLLRPAAEGRFAGVVLFSEIYQVTAPIRRLAAMVAGMGHVVAVPEVYHEYEPAGTVLAYDQAGTDRGNELKYAKPVAAYDDDARAAVAWLASHPACTGRIATMGVCLGGHLAFRAAMNPAVSAAACFYATDIHSATLGQGRHDDSLDRMGDIPGEVMMVWGRQDPHVPFAGRQAIRAALEQAGVRYEWHEVNAQHAFLRDEGPRYDPALFLQAMGWTTSLFGRTLQAG
ncbi:dienelactone hydrolase family protein [Gluconacetobacter azotocaptans]|uniref:Dienelactone hydrolase family protein n=1 Tax=Gluconacetobacter azotocaptans TaxID=142834 RepID=A0A7W4JS36_9PROT|nr:dienelactone hydrolase family protein [Gluconacetobacter azotocaptans]MBB2189850.1 dienelactone hydrolase family protein [Gluconacetobacter azotocaptans]MBM9402689.1 dienelactone hydrolase family protein [Gluconacetobacter azotocaptans]GBQ29530.1 carboxymethylenebutenolidase [Gluconacetobacter azotocaptans DSM 13594]